MLRETCGKTIEGLTVQLTFTIHQYLYFIDKRMNVRYPMINKSLVLKPLMPERDLDFLPVISYHIEKRPIDVVTREPAAQKLDNHIRCIGIVRDTHLGHPLIKTPDG
jgi:hypothetical protein